MKSFAKLLLLLGVLASVATAATVQNDAARPPDDTPEYPPQFTGCG
jgi:hypothetical protein